MNKNYWIKYALTLNDLDESILISSFVSKWHDQ